jgi:hypothetical protein
MRISERPGPCLAHHTWSPPGTARPEALRPRGKYRLAQFPPPASRASESGNSCLQISGTPAQFPPLRALQRLIMLVQPKGAPGSPLAHNHPFCPIFQIHDSTFRGQKHDVLSESRMRNVASAHMWRPRLGSSEGGSLETT